MKSAREFVEEWDTEIKLYRRKVGEVTDEKTLLVEARDKELKDYLFARWHATSRLDSVDALEDDNRRKRWRKYCKEEGSVSYASFVLIDIIHDLEEKGVRVNREKF